MDPTASLSDWTIRIIEVAADGEANGKTDNSNKHGKPRAAADSSNKKKPAPASAKGNKTTTTTTQLYHVHRNILSVGANGSGYFRQLFQSTGNFAETQTRTSTLTLHPLAAQAFPVVLDYLYSWDDDLAVTPQNAAALHHLGRYLQMDRLAWKVRRQFWRQSSNSNRNNCAEYYRHAQIFSDATLKELVVKKCARNILEIQPDWTDWMEASDAELWLGILLHQHKQQQPMMPWVESRHASRLLDEFLKNSNANSSGDDDDGDELAVDAETFAQLTDARVLPHIDPAAAVTLLRWEQKLGLSDSKNICNSGSDDSTELTPLQERCVETLASLDGQRLEQHEAELGKLNSRVVSRLLVRVAKQQASGGGGGGGGGERPRRFLPASWVARGRRFDDQDEEEPQADDS